MQHKNCSDKKFWREPIIVNENNGWKDYHLFHVKVGLCTSLKLICVPFFLGNLPNLPNSVVCDFTWSRWIHPTFEVIATSFRMYLSLFSLPKSIGGWEGTEQEGQSQAIFSIHLWKKLKFIELYLCTLDLWALISHELMDLRPKGAGFFKVMYWSKRSLVHLVWDGIMKE
jgi:hypothetical protein